MSRIISPPVEQLDNLRQPLTRGEKLVFEFFNSLLPIEWEIYIQPHLNGLRPDFVLLHPKVGIAVFEIKDWNINAMEYSVNSRDNKSPILIGKKNGEEFSLQSQNPIEKINIYKKELHELYCPRLNQKAGFAVITAGVIFPFAKEEEIKKLFHKSLEYRNMLDYSDYYPLTGLESIHSKNLNNIFPASKWQTSKYMNEVLANDLRSWLVEPDFSALQREPLDLDYEQRAFVTSRTKSGYRRIKGAAGSGKSLVLAARAAELLGQGKQVLVITFNITLLHYLMDIAVRWPQASGKTRKDTTWLNYHSWCKRVCQENDFTAEYDNLSWSDNLSGVLSYELPRLVSHILDNNLDYVTQKYDAILVDEGQDFLPNWWDSLRKVCKVDGEMLLVADATQDIYDTAQSWTDEAMSGAGFSGSWAELKISHRLPPALLKYVGEFANSFLPKNTIDLPISKQGELDLFPCTLKWVQTNMALSANVTTEELLALVSSPDNIIAIPDITFLCDSTKKGLEVVSKLGMKGIKTVHTYDENLQESRRKKMGFYMGDARIKATTLHSFKGWESRAIVIFIGNSIDKKSLALIYAGLTRLKKHSEGSYLTVVSCADKLLDYGKSWPEYLEKI